jgi:hypothetical protein
MPEVKAMLRICARYLYGWHCDHESMANAIAIIDEWDDWGAYPESWPNRERKAIPLGTVKLDAGIRQSAARRLAQIRADIEHAGNHYPREKVRKALDYWKIVL